MKKADKTVLGVPHPRYHHFCMHCMRNNRISHDFRLRSRQGTTRLSMAWEGMFLPALSLEVRHEADCRFPFQIEHKRALPLYSIGLTVIISMLLALINIGSTAAFNAFVSLVVAAPYAIFLISASVMLHKRLTTPASELEWGPFRLGQFGVPVTIASIVYTVIGLLFSFFPASASVTPLTMNWAILLFGAAMIVSLVFWAVHGRHVYRGPVLEVSLSRTLANNHPISVTKTGDGSHC